MFEEFCFFWSNTFFIEVRKHKQNTDIHEKERERKEREREIKERERERD